MIKPLNKNVVLKKEVNENKTASGIILSTESKEVPSIALVEAISSKCDTALKVGAKVIYKEYAGSEVEVDGEKYIVVDEEDVLAIID